MVRPPNIACWLDDRPSWPSALALALQHLAVQAVYFVLPVAVAGTLTDDPAALTRYLCLSILAAALWQGLQLIRRGPIGSGYAIPGSQSAAMIGAYGLAAADGIGFAGCAAMLVIAVATLATVATQRLRILLPNEVAGVVVMLVGVAMVPLGLALLGVRPGEALPSASAFAVAGGTMLLMAAIALSGTRIAPFGVLVGAALGVVPALLLDHARADAPAALAAQPWLALPEPWLPAFAEVQAGPMLAFLLALIAMKAACFGTIATFQRGADADWSRPDAPPIRRGFLANGLAIAAAGLVGAAPPGPAASAVGLSVSTGTLARRIVWVGFWLLLLVALCPKLLTLFVLVPAPVKAAILLYLAGLLLAQGAQLATARLLDARRALVVGLGLSAGLAVVAAPELFKAALPVLASPLSFGALVAFLANLVTQPLVIKRAELRLPLDLMASRAAPDWFYSVAGSWGLKATTAKAVERALAELIGVLAERGHGEAVLAASRAEDRVLLTLRWPGPPLPVPKGRPAAEALLGSDEERQGVAIWLGLREVAAFSQVAVKPGTEARLVFED